MPTIIAGFLAEGLPRMNFTSDFSAWYAGPGIVILIAVLALTAWSFRTSLGGRKVFEGDILER